MSFSAVLIVDRDKAELICSGVEFHSLCAKKACIRAQHCDQYSCICDLTILICD